MIYRLPRSLISYHTLVFFALSCASWNTATVSHAHQSESMARREEGGWCLKTRGKETEVRTLPFRTVHSFSKRRDACVPTAGAGSGGRLQGREMLRLINHFWEPGAECLWRVEQGRTEVDKTRGTEVNWGRVEGCVR